MVDGAGVHVAVDGELLAGHRVECKARAHFGHAPGALGDDDEIDDQDHAEDHEPDQDRATHDEIGKPLDHLARRVSAGMALPDDEFCRGNVKR